MTKKDFTKNNPVSKFITQPMEHSTGTTMEEVKPVVKGRPKSDKETKKRISLLIRPSLYEDVGKIAYMNKLSTSEQISYCLEKLVEESQDKIKKYDELN